MEVDELEGALLDLWVGRANGWKVTHNGNLFEWNDTDGSRYMRDTTNYRASGASFCK